VDRLDLGLLMDLNQTSCPSALGVMADLFWEWGRADAATPLRDSGLLTLWGDFDENFLAAYSRACGGEFDTAYGDGHYCGGGHRHGHGGGTAGGGGGNGTGRSRALWPSRRGYSDNPSIDGSVHQYNENLHFLFSHLHQRRGTTMHELEVDRLYMIAIGGGWMFVGRFVKPCGLFGGVFRDCVNICRTGPASWPDLCLGTGRVEASFETYPEDQIPFPSVLFAVPWSGDLPQNSPKES
jgi:hypothetical protein